MKFSFAPLLVLAATTVSADFLIYTAHSEVAQDGGGGASSGTGAWFFNSEPSCDDVGNSIFISGGSDASHGGFACDGCNDGSNPADWDITRFEFYDDGSSAITTGQLGHVTLYEDQGYQLSWISLDGSQSGIRGSCTRLSDSPDDFYCAGPTTEDDGVAIFSCSTDLTTVV